MADFEETIIFPTFVEEIDGAVITSLTVYSDSMRKSMENGLATTIFAGAALSLDSEGKLKYATKASYSPCEAFATQSIAASASGWVLFNGFLELADWTEVIGTASLVPNQKYYLATDGQLSASPAVSGYSQCVGRAVTNKILEIHIQPNIKL